MSYARFGERSDVYVILHTSRSLVCYCEPFYASSTEEMLEHLQGHIDRGDTVPDRTISGLRDDAEANDRWMQTGEWSIHEVAAHG